MQLLHLIRGEELLQATLSLAFRQKTGHRVTPPTVTSPAAGGTRNLVVSGCLTPARRAAQLAAKIWIIRRRASGTEAREQERVQKLRFSGFTRVCNLTVRNKHFVAGANRRKASHLRVRSVKEHHAIWSARVIEHGKRGVDTHANLLHLIVQYVEVVQIEPAKDINEGLDLERLGGGRRLRPRHKVLCEPRHLAKYLESLGTLFRALGTQQEHVLDSLLVTDRGSQRVHQSGQQHNCLGWLVRR
jgi:hypothetical protein